MVRAVDSVKRRIDKCDTVGKLRGSAFGTLEMLFHVGPLQQKEIGEKLLISKSNVVAIIDRLEKRGLVRRERSVEDRRCIFVYLTEPGQALVEQILPGHVAAITEAMSYLTVAEQQEFSILCRKLGLGE